MTECGNDKSSGVKRVRRKRAIPTTTLSDFDSYIRAAPDFYSVVVFKGRGCFIRVEASSLEQARADAKRLASVSTRPVGIYAVRDNLQSHMENVSEKPRICATCRRDTKAPMFDGCMNNPCPRGYEPCL